MEKKLTVMVGMPGAGKSTLAAKMVENPNTISVSSDEIRERINGDVNDQSNADRVFKIFAQEIRDGLKEGKHVIADQTALTRRAHELLLDIARPFHIKPTVVFFTNEAQARTRNLDRERQVPEHVMDRMAQNLKNIRHYLNDNQDKFTRIMEIS